MSGSGRLQSADVTPFANEGWRGERRMSQRHVSSRTHSRRITATHNPVVFLITPQAENTSPLRPAELSVSLITQVTGDKRTVNNISNITFQACFAPRGSDKALFPMSIYSTVVPQHFNTKGRPFRSKEIWDEVRHERTVVESKCGSADVIVPRCAVASLAEQEERFFTHHYTLEVFS
ncbi:hypothetical protein Bbelb_365940 [Branchiostoma belcheri]|nr:hypothetical protein Bbelb_365940 [Branchiostoma belcheri]